MATEERTNSSEEDSLPAGDVLAERIAQGAAQPGAVAPRPVTIPPRPANAPPSSSPSASPLARRLSNTPPPPQVNGRASIPDAPRLPALPPPLPFSAQSTAPRPR